MSSFNLINKKVSAKIGPQLKQLRLENQLSLEELRDKTHLNLKLLRRMENGKSVI